MKTVAISPGVKRPDHESDHSPPFTAEAKNAYSYNSNPPNVFMAWCLVEHRNFTLYEAKIVFFFLGRGTLLRSVNTVQWKTGQAKLLPLIV